MDHLSARGEVVFGWFLIFVSFAMGLLEQSQ